MSNIVIELEKECMDDKISIDMLLRKAFVVSRKLKLNDFTSWIQVEQNGYEKDVPKYRKVAAVVKAWNPYRGWIPVIMPADMGKHFNDIPLFHSIYSLEEFYSENKERFIRLSVPPELQDFLNECGDGILSTQFCYEISISEIRKVLSAVRNIILEWTLTLEDNGIYGEGMSFNAEEKMVAGTTEKIINYTNNFYQQTSAVCIKQENFE